MNEKSRTANSMLNVSSGMLAQIIQMILGFISRTVFIKYLAVEYLGISSLFSNILSMLSLAELGLGAVFVYSLYKPLAEGNKTEISTIIKFYRSTYSVVGIFIFITGAALVPFLSDIIPDKPAAIIEDIRLIYLIYIFNTASSYFFSYKVSLLDADQKISVATKNAIIFAVIQQILQIIILITTSNFIIYLLTQLVMQFLSNLYISKKVDKQYPFLREYSHLKIDKIVKNKILSDVKATFLVKIGGVLVNGTDNLFINYFVGLAILGKYSNYLMLMTMVSSLVMIIFANLKSSIANVIVKESLEKQRQTFKVLNFLNFWLFGLCTVMFMFSVEDFITVWVGTQFQLPHYITIIMAISFFMVGMQNGFWTFKGAFGFFHEGKYMVLGTALINLVLSYFLGKEYGIAGVLMATVIARLLTNSWYDPYIVLKKGLKMKPLQYLLEYFKYIGVLILSILIISGIFQYIEVQSIWGLLLKLAIIFVTVNFVIVIIFRKSEELRYSWSLLFGILQRTKNLIK